MPIGTTVHVCQSSRCDGHHAEIGLVDLGLFGQLKVGLHYTSPARKRDRHGKVAKGKGILMSPAISSIAQPDDCATSVSVLSGFYFLSLRAGSPPRTAVASPRRPHRLPPRAGLRSGRSSRFAAPAAPEACFPDRLRYHRVWSSRKAVKTTVHVCGPRTATHVPDCPVSAKPAVIDYAQ